MLHIACAADATYVPYCGSMLASLLRRHPQTTVHLLHSPALAAAVLQPLAEMVEHLGGRLIAHRIPDEQINGLPSLSYISRAMWYRIWLPELVQEERILYVDCDTLIVDDLAPLWDLDLRGHYLAAVNGVPVPGEEDWRKRLGVPGGGDYFNSGVLLLNLDALRADGMTARLLDYARGNLHRLKWPDQDALNVVLGQRRLPLHPRWNCQNTIFSAADRASLAFPAQEVAEAAARPAILHFEGPGDCKPWHFLCAHPWVGEYRRFMAATPWADQPLLGHNWQNRLIAATLPRDWRVPVYARLEHYKRRLGLRSELG